MLMLSASVIESHRQKVAARAGRHEADGNTVKETNHQDDTIGTSYASHAVQDKVHKRNTAKQRTPNNSMTTTARMRDNPQP